MGHRRQAAGWIRWTVLLGVWGAGFGVGLPGKGLEGEEAIAATPFELTTWRFNPDRQQLEVVLPNGTTPRYFLLAQPARIVIDLPAVEAGAAAGEQTYGGAVRRVRVAQFEPGLTRIVMELTPEAELAPGQVELARAETLASGETRWILRPLLISTTPAQAEPNAVAAISPSFAPTPSPEPTIRPVMPEGITPLPAIEPILNPSESPVSSVPESTPTPDPVMQMAIPEGNGVIISVPSADSAIQSNPLPLETELEPISPDAVVGMGIPESDAIAIPVPSPEVTPVAPSESSRVEPTDQSIMTEPPRLSDEAPILIGQGAEFLTTEPASTPVIEPRDEALTSMAPDDTVDFPAPPLLEAEASSPGVPSSISVPPPLAPATSVPNAVVPPLDASAPNLEPESVAVAPTQPNVLIPAGQTLQLRYPRPSALTLTEQPWQEVLVLANPVQDAQGAVLVPAGTQVIGRFEPDGRGYRFVAQAIALNDTVLLLQGSSAIFRDDSIEPNTVIDLDVNQDLRRSPNP